MFATYLTNKELVSRIAEKPKNQKEKALIKSRQHNKQTLHRRDVTGSEVQGRILSFISYARKMEMKIIKETLSHPWRMSNFKM